MKLRNTPTKEPESQNLLSTNYPAVGPRINREYRLVYEVLGDADLIHHTKGYYDLSGHIFVSTKTFSIMKKTFSIMNIFLICDFLVIRLHTKSYIGSQHLEKN